MGVASRRMGWKPRANRTSDRRAPPADGCSTSERRRPASSFTFNTPSPGETVPESVGRCEGAGILLAIRKKLPAEETPRKQARRWGSPLGHA